MPCRAATTSPNTDEKPKLKNFDMQGSGGDHKPAGAIMSRFVSAWMCVQGAGAIIKNRMPHRMKCGSVGSPMKALCLLELVSR